MSGIFRVCAQSFTKVFHCTSVILFFRVTAVQNNFSRVSVFPALQVKFQQKIVMITRLVLLLLNER